MPEEGISLSPKSHIMTADEIETIAKTFIALGVKKIRLTGGEPLVRKDAKDILLRLGKLNTELTLTTNGILVHEYIDVFKQAGIKSLNVSCDSLQKEKYEQITRRDQFNKLWDNIELLLANGFQVKLNVVLIKGFNDNEITDYVELTKKYNIQVRFIEFMPFSGNQWDKSKLVSYATVMEVITEKYASHRVIRLNDKPNDTAKNHKIASYLGSFSVISSITNPFCGTCNRIRLTADGKLKNCLFSNTETALLPTLRAGKNIVPLIYDSILAKHKIRAGMDDATKIQNPELFNKNRSMITIGG